MRKKIQKSMILVITTTLIIAYAITIFFVYGRVRDLASGNVENVARYIAASLNTYGSDTVSWLDGVESDIRLTLIDKNGNVTYDTVQDEFTFANHSDRPEVKEALAEGSGEDIRRSDTLGSDMFYYAVKLNDGNIIRVSETVRSLSFTALELLPMMLIIMAGMILIAWLISKKQAEELVRPINELKLDDPLRNDTYEELHPLLVRIDEQNKAKDAIADMRKEFSANVSHELKTPLTSISGYAEIMKDGLVKPEDIQTFSGRIYKESQRLVTLIDDIIQLSKLDEGAVTGKAEQLELFSLSKDVVESLDCLAARDDVKLEISGEPCTITGVRQLVQEMIYNITENAIKYNRKGGRVSVWVGSTLSGSKVVVTDTGIGIPDDQLERIFERFYRVDKSHSRETGGTGLGLSIVKHSAMLCNAKINVKSKLGNGTQMEIEFPESNVTGDAPTE